MYSSLVRHIILLSIMSTPSKTALAGPSEQAVAAAMQTLAAEHRADRQPKLPPKQLRLKAIEYIEDQTRGELRTIAIMDIMSENGWRPFG